MKSAGKRLITMLLCAALAFTMTPVSGVFKDEAKGATKYKKVKNVSKFKYKKFVQGDLTKNQLSQLLESVTHFAYEGVSKKKTITEKELKGRVTNEYKTPGVPLALAVGTMTNYGEYESTYNNIYTIASVNRVLSFFSDYRYKKNTDYTNENDYYDEEEDWLYNSYTDDTYLYFVTGFGWMGDCAIRSVKYNNKYMLIGYDRTSYDTQFGAVYAGRYVATLKKQANKKYKLVKIKPRKPTAKEGARDKYISLLDRAYANNYSISYKYFNLNSKGVNELLLESYDGTMGSGSRFKIYTYTKGKIKKILSITEYGLNKVTSYKKGKTISLYFKGHGHENYRYFKRNKSGKYIEIAGKGRESKAGGSLKNGPWGYSLKKKAVSKKAFNKKVRPLLKGKKRSTRTSKWKYLDIY